MIQCELYLVPQRVMSTKPAPANDRSELDDWLKRALLTTVSGRRAGQIMSERADRLVLRAARHLPDDVSLYAVGGYGRGELSPRSDLDLLILGSPEPERVSRMTDELGNAGYRAAAATRTVAENEAMAHEDLTVATGLLEVRRLTGPGDLATLGVEALQARGELALIDEIERGTRARHERFGDSVYLLEPNLKLGRGGLRDVHRVLWLIKALFDRRGLAGLITAPDVLRIEAQRVLEAYDFVLSLRHFAHLASGWKNDRLTFSLQSAVAEQTGLGRRTHRQHPVESLMRAYYRHAETIEERTARWADRWRIHRWRKNRAHSPIAFRDWGGVGLDDTDSALPFAVVDGRFAIEPGRRLAEEAARDPRVLVDAIRLAGLNGLRLHPELAEELAFAARSVGSSWHRDPGVAAATLALIVDRDGDPTMVSSSAALGLFYTALPEFRPIHGWVHHDVYHLYAVDVHSLRAHRLALALLRGELPSSEPWIDALAGELNSPEVFLVAALIHDVGKGRGGNHSIIGEKLAHGIGERFEASGRWTQANTQRLGWLVRHHLALSMASQRRDPGAPETIEDVALLVETVERLVMLTALTIVDSRAVRPDTPDRWKSALLLELYSRVRHAIEMPPGVAPLATRRRRQMAQILSLDGRPQRDWLSRLPDRMLEAQPLSRVRTAMEVLGEYADSTEAFAAKVEQDDSGSLVVTVACANEQGLLARIAGALSMSGGNILRAAIYTLRTDGPETDNPSWQVAIDVFDVASGLEPSRFQASFARLFREAEPPDFLQTLADRSRSYTARQATPPVERRVRVDHSASETETVVEVRVRDRPGLLHVLAGAMSEVGVEIFNCLAVTEGAVIVDVFYVRKDGSKLTARASKRLVETVERALDGFEARIHATSSR